MLKLTVFAAFLAFCCAQPPPPNCVRPDLPETFVSTSSLFRKVGPHEMRAHGAWSRSETKQAIMTSSIYNYDNGTESNENLVLFMEHEEYNIRVDESGKKVCTQRSMSDDMKFPMVWDWLKEATCHEFTDKRTGKTYDSWVEHEHSDHHGNRVLLVNPAEPNKPIALMSRDRDVEHDERFMSFEPTEPPATAFTVPEECRHPPKNL